MGEIMADSTTDAINQPPVGEDGVLFRCDPECARIKYVLSVAEGKVAPYEGKHKTTWVVALEQAHAEALTGRGFCTNLRFNGAEGSEGWCFLNMTGGKKETAPLSE
ncbi:MAG: hypothetical protein AAB481_00890 [Patescibacteria group bacterium]